MEIRRLVKLSRNRGGWIYFDDEDEETWISQRDWEQMFQSNKGSYKLD